MEPSNPKDFPCEIVWYAKGAMSPNERWREFQFLPLGCNILSATQSDLGIDSIVFPDVPFELSIEIALTRKDIDGGVCFVQQPLFVAVNGD